MQIRKVYLIFTKYVSLIFNNYYLHRWDFPNGVIIFEGSELNNFIVTIYN